MYILGHELNKDIEITSTHLCKFFEIDNSLKMLAKAFFVVLNEHAPQWFKIA